MCGKADSAAAYTGGLTWVVAGTDLSLQVLEPSFGQDLNGDGIVGLLPSQVIQVNGTTSLDLFGSQYVVVSGGGTAVALQFQDTPATVGAFGAWSAIGTATIAGGSEVPWHHTCTTQYVVWGTDTAGAYTGGLTWVVPGTGLSL